MTDYDRLEREHDGEQPTKVADHSLAWAKLEPVQAVNGTVQARILEFCASKRITVEGLVALGTRVDTTKPGDVRLAWGYPAFRGGRHVVTAVKYRDIGTGRKVALKPSVFLKPLVIGNQESLDVFIAEGETDACRLYDLVGDAAQILCLPAGAKTWKKSWMDYVPRGAVVHLAYDADTDGDEGAEKARRMLGGGVRVRPPDGHKDWCVWPGSRRRIRPARRPGAQAARHPLRRRAVEHVPRPDRGEAGLSRGRHPPGGRRRVPRRRAEGGEDVGGARPERVPRDRRALLRP